MSYKMTTDSREVVHINRLQAVADAINGGGLGGGVKGASYDYYFDKCSTKKEKIEQIILYAENFNLYNARCKSMIILSEKEATSIYRCLEEEDDRKRDKKFWNLQDQEDEEQDQEDEDLYKVV